MFHSIKLLKQEVVDDKLRVTFNVKDACFSQDVEIVGTQVGAPYFEPIAIFKTYALRNLNVTRNLAIYYVTLGEGETYIDQDKVFIDRHFSSLGYGKRYFALVKRYYHDLQLLIREYDKQEQIKKVQAAMRNFANLE